LDEERAYQLALALSLRYQILTELTSFFIEVKDLQDN
jgi:hypothetical protein